MLSIPKTKLKDLCDRISSKMPLYIPLEKGGEVNFGKYEEGVKVNLDVLKTVKSAKDLFFPQSETMMKFKTDSKTITIEDIRKDMEEFVLFGVKACDFKSFEVLDNVFLQEPVDTFYKARRDAGIIVTLACNKPELSCFCKVFNLDASNPLGDVTSWIDAENIYLKANTEKGKKVVDVVKDLGVEVDDGKVDSLKNDIKTKIDKLPYANLDLSRFKEENLNELFNLPDWKDLSEACLGCGTCTFVCPTCQCFDIRDFKTNDGVIRFRCWDSCMYSDFTQMAAANSRTTQLQRYRQRFMHKLVYYPSQYNGTFSCVGCGRCVNKCPQHLNIIKVIKKIGGKNNG